MITISRYTTYYQIPVQIAVETDAGVYNLVIPAGYSNIELDGNRILNLAISNVEYFAVRIVADGVEYTLDQVQDLTQLVNVQAITISDGFIYPLGYNTGGFTVRNVYQLGNRFFESGISRVFKGCDCEGKFLAPN